MSVDFNSLPVASRPKNEAWGNFAKFAKVGDRVQGYIRDVFYQPKKDMFQEGRGITLEQEDGSLINVIIKRWPSNLEATNHFRIGDPLAVVFKETKKSNYPQPMKIFQFFGQNLPENAANKTVLEAEKADMESSNTATPEGEDGDELESMAAEAAAKIG